MIRNEADLEEILSRPNDRDIAAMQALQGPLLILGAGGKMGPTLCLRAKRAGAPHVIAVARFSSPGLRERLQHAGIETIASDLLADGELSRLPDAPHIIFMAAMKFGTSDAGHLTWAMNTYLPGLVAHRFRAGQIVAFSTGNVYPLVAIASGGADENCTPNPVGEYAQSALGRERMFEYGSRKFGTPVAVLRLNYATELRYGVLLDIGQKVLHGIPVDLSMSRVNVIWQGDANSVCLRSLPHCQSPPMLLNLTGPEVLSVRWIADRFGRHLSIEPKFQGVESSTALLSNSSRLIELFGPPEVTPSEMIEWIAMWLRHGGTTLGKPTHFETRDGRF